MICTNKDIQELLPAYLEQALEGEERSRVELHLASCGDCRSSLELIRMLAEEPVPDPGEAFWSAMPGRVRRAVRAAEEERSVPWWRSFGAPLSITLPRWAWTVASFLVVAAVSSMLVRPAPLRVARPAPTERSAQKNVLPPEALEFAELSETEVDAVDLWATEELALLQDDMIDTFRNSADLSLDDRLTELNAEELESLSNMLDSQNEEG